MEVYNKELDEKIRKLYDVSKEELLQALFEGWVGDINVDKKFLNAVKDKIKRDFNVTINI